MPVSPMSNLKVNIQEVVNPITQYEKPVKIAVNPCLPAALMPVCVPYYMQSIKLKMQITGQTLFSSSIMSSWSVYIAIRYF